MKITPNLIENLEFSDIVRGSDEDFEILYKKDDPDKVYNSEIAFYCKRFVCTRGASPVVVYGKDHFRKEYPTPLTKTVSTIGAGDNFNAGFIFSMIKQGITLQDLDRGLTENQWDELVKTGQEFSAECCKDIYNYISNDNGRSLR